MTTSRSRLLAAAGLGGAGLGAAGLCVLALPAAAQDLTLPSGRAARLFDVVLEAGAGEPTAPDAFTDPEAEEGDAALADLGDEPLGEAEPSGDGTQGDARTGGLARFRLVVPGLGGGDFDAVAGDFGWVCESVALPALAANSWTPTEVVVSLADREVAFGVADPAATQFFEGFRVEDGACVPQAF